MYAARNNFIKSAIAIAVGSYAFSPLEAGVKTIKLHDKSPDGKIFERTMTLTPLAVDPFQLPSRWSLKTPLPTRNPPHFPPS